MSMIPWDQLTLLGDSVVTLPIAAAILLWLVAGRAWEMALGWCFLFCGGMALVVVTKVAFIGWGIGLSAIDFAGFSGHSMRAAAIFPVLFYLLLQHAPAVRRPGILLGVLLGVLVASSRVAVGAHSVSESISGALLGSAVALGFMLLSRVLPKPRMNRWLVAFSFFCLLPTSYAEPAPTNDWLQAVALYLSGHERPYVRDDERFAVIEGET